VHDVSRGHRTRNFRQGRIWTDVINQISLRNSRVRQVSKKSNDTCFDVQNVVIVAAASTHEFNKHVQFSICHNVYDPYVQRNLSETNAKPVTRGN
jgi:hypothetical protein